jgi:DNA processing protein
MSAVADLVALTLLPIWRWRLVAEQLRAGHPPYDILMEHCDSRATSRRTRRGHRAPSADALRSRASEALARAARTDLHVVAWTDPVYPPALAAIVDPPPVFWIRGAIAALDMPAVAIVGSRAGSPYALAAAERLSADLAASGVAVVSGLARGVDSAAHRAALSGGGTTVAVLGSGADVVYPREHAALAAEIARSGAILSELVPGTPPHAAFFPQRNRIISGLSRAVVVVEAGEKSGSLITARCALEQGRDVLAVPGNILNGRNRGGHALLRDGAKIVETADDILEELGLAAAGGPGGPRSPGNPGNDEPYGLERASNETIAPARSRGPDPLLACLIPGEPCDLDALAARSGLTPARLLPRLFELEMQGRIRRIGGGRFVSV